MTITDKEREEATEMVAKLREQGEYGLAAKIEEAVRSEVMLTIQLW